MKQQAFTCMCQDNGMWRILYYEKPVGLGLTLQTAEEAETIADHLNLIYNQTRSQGYDEGYRSAERMRWA